MERADYPQVQAHVEAVMQSTKRELKEIPASHTKAEEEKEDRKTTRLEDWMKEEQRQEGARTDYMKEAMDVYKKKKSIDA